MWIVVGIQSKDGKNGTEFVLDRYLKVPADPWHTKLEATLKLSTKSLADDVEAQQLIIDTCQVRFYPLWILCSITRLRM